MKLSILIINRLIIAILLLGMLTYNSKKVVAAQVNFDVKPNFVEITSKKGQSIPLDFTLFNKSDHAYFDIEFRSYGKNHTILPYSTSNNPVKIATKTVDKTFFVKKGESTKISLQIDVDPLAREQDYSVIANITQLNKSDLISKNNLFIDSTIQIPILITVSDNGSTQEVLMIHYCDLNHRDQFQNTIYKYFKIIDSGSNPEIDCVVENIGKNRLVANIGIEYKNNLAQSGHLNTPPSVILPSNKYHTSLAGLTGFKRDFTPPLRLEHWLLGKYDLKTTFTNPISNKKWSADTHFYAFPYKFGAISLSLILLAIHFFKRRR